MTNNHHFMLVVSVLIFAGCFLAAYWLDSRKVFMGKMGFKETKLTKTTPQPPLPIGRELPRELLTVWIIASTIWIMFAIEHTLGTCKRVPGGFSCLIGGNDWMLQTHLFRWRDAFRILLFLATFPVVGLVVGTATLWVLTGFSRSDDLCDLD